MSTCGGVWGHVPGPQVGVANLSPNGKGQEKKNAWSEGLPILEPSGEFQGPLELIWILKNKKRNLERYESCPPFILAKFIPIEVCPL